jgi:ribosome-associated protein
MEDTASNREKIIEIAELLEEHLAENTQALDVHQVCSWTDYFIICTIRSQTHLRGLLNSLRDYFHKKRIDIPIGHKSIKDESWVLIDCGNFVIHLMDREKREFYELEKLWFRSERIFQSSNSS